MDDDFSNIPEGFRSGMRKLLLKQLQDTSSYDVFEIELFEWYVRETEELIKGMVQDEKQFIESQVKDGADEINDSGIVAVEYFAKRIRYSHVIYLVSLLELFLQRECDRMSVALNPDAAPFELNELKGDQWSTKRKYLERYGKFTIPDEVWERVMPMITLRNILVHDNGLVDSVSKGTKSMLEQNRGISLTNIDIGIEPEFIEDGIKAMRELSDFVDQRISDVISRAIQPRSIG